MFSDVVHYHCSEFQIFRPLNGSHFSVLSLYPNSVQNQARFCLHFSDHGKPKQTDVIFSCFHWLIMGGFPQKLTNRWFFPSVRYITRMIKLSLFHINTALNEIDICAVRHVYAITVFSCTNLNRHHDVIFFNATSVVLAFQNSRLFTVM